MNKCFKKILEAKTKAVEQKLLAYGIDPKKTKVKRGDTAYIAMGLGWVPFKVGRQVYNGAFEYASFPFFDGDISECNSLVDPSYFYVVSPNIIDEKQYKKYVAMEKIYWS